MELTDALHLWFANVVAYYTHSSFIEEEDGKTHCVHSTKDTELDLTSRTDAPPENKPANDGEIYIHS